MDGSIFPPGLWDLTTLLVTFQFKKVITCPFHRGLCGLLRATFVITPMDVTDFLWDLDDTDSGRNVTF